MLLMNMFHTMSNNITRVLRRDSSSHNMMDFKNASSKLLTLVLIGLFLFQPLIAVYADELTAVEQEGTVSVDSVSEEQPAEDSIATGSESAEPVTLDAPLPESEAEAGVPGEVPVDTAPPEELPPDSVPIELPPGSTIPEEVPLGETVPTAEVTPTESGGGSTEPVSEVVTPDAAPVVEEVDEVELPIADLGTDTPIIIDTPTDATENTPEIPVVALDSDSLILGNENKLAFTPLTQVSGDKLRIKLSDYDIPGLKEGEEISISQAVSVIIGTTTKKSELETPTPAPIPALVPAVAPLVESLAPLFVEQSEIVPLIPVENTLADIAQVQSTTDAIAKIEAIATEISEKPAGIDEIIEITADSSQKGDIQTIDSQYISFESGSLIMVVERPVEIAPGAYTIGMTVTNPVTGQDFTFTQEVVWGVLTMNTDQDVYRVGKRATIDIGILDGVGQPVCGLSPELKINGQVVGVTETPQCELFDSQNIIPDYTAVYTFETAGEYTLELSVDNGNGLQSLTQTVVVIENPDFIISRAMATRLYPAGVSPASFTISTEVDFAGTVTETLPASFVVIEAPASATVAVSGDIQTITWSDVAIPAGTTKTFSYTYNAPDISPMYYTVGPVRLIGVDGSVVYTEARTWGIANDVISDGANALDIIGQYTTTGGFTANYTQAIANNNNGSVYALGFDTPAGKISFDTVDDRIFVPDDNNSRILVFNTDAQGNLVDKTPDFVLGQSNFTSNSTATSATQFGGLSLSTAYDSANKRLFVADMFNNRVMIFDVTSITNGESAVNVLGKANFTTGASGTTASTMFFPKGVVYDAVNNRLFVGEYGNNRITVFDTTSIVDGESAVSVLGQADFVTSASGGTTQSALNNPGEMAYDSTGNRLFVLDGASNRVVVYDVTVITDGENAVNVLGQPDFVTGDAGTTQSVYNGPQSVDYDSVNNRLFVADRGNARVLVHDVASITDGENAINVLGQSDFVSFNGATTQSGTNLASGVSYDAENELLYVSEDTANRIKIYDVAPAPTVRVEYSGGGFAETTTNNGVVSGVIEATIVGDTFQDTDTDNILDIGSEVTVNNIPAGLTGSIALLSAPDVTSWSTSTSAADNNWRSVTYGNGLFVAVSNGGTGNRVMTSPDGITWTSRTSAADNFWISVAYGNGLFVAVSNTGTISDRVMTSPDGITWTSRTSAADNAWTSVTYGNGVFVAVSSNGAGNRVMTSPDGITWTSRTNAAENAWNSVTYGNGLFVAVSANGVGNRVMTSPDGITWTSRTSAADNNWTSVTYGNGIFVAVSSGGTNRVMYSADGITWTAASAAAANGWNSVTYGNGLFVAVSVTGTGDRVMTSPNGITWTSRTSAAENSWMGVTYGNGLFVAISQTGTGTRVMKTAAGIADSVAQLTLTGTASVHQNANDVADITFEFDDTAFTATAAANVTGATGPASSGYGVNFDDNNWRIDYSGGGMSEVVANNGAVSGVIEATLLNDTFQDIDADNILDIGSEVTVNNIPAGLTGSIALGATTQPTSWTSASAAEANSWQSIAYGNGIFVAVSATGTNRVMYSTDGITWTAASAAEANSWVSVTYGSGIFVAVSADGTNRVMYSTNGISWTAASASEVNNWQSVTYGNDIFVAVSADGTNRAMYSTNGISWTAASAAEANTWVSITYGNGKFVAVAIDGTNRVMYSNDGITWTSAAATEANSWRSVTYGNDKFVAVSSDGTNRVMYSTDGITWAAASAAEANNWQSVTYGNGRYVAVAHTGTNRVMYSADGITWTAVAAAEANLWSEVVYGKGGFVAISNTGTNRVMYSSASNTADTLASLTLTGSATSHQDANDVADITFEFDDAAFSAATASNVINATGPASSGFGINFYNNATITYGALNAYDLSTKVAGASVSVAAQEAGPQGFTTNPDGTTLYLVGTSGDINIYEMTTSFDLSTISFVTNVSVSSQEAYPTGIKFNADGTKMFITGFASDSVHEYTLSSAYDPTTASFVDSFSVSAQETTVRDLAFNNDGTRMYIVGNNRTAYQYDLSVGFDISTASFDTSYNATANISSFESIIFSHDGTRMYGSDSNNIELYSLATAFDVSTVSHLVSYGGLGLSLFQIEFDYDGTHLLIADASNDELDSYTIGSGQHNLFVETPGNTGSVSGQLAFILETETFNDPDSNGILTACGGAVVCSGHQVEVVNLPAGFTPVVNLYDADGVTANITDSAVVGTLTLTGSATLHQNANDISDLTFTFSNSAFNNFAASEIIGATGPASSGSGINFNDAASYTFSGTVYTNEGVTNIGAGKTINIFVNGVLAGSDATDGLGVYSITGIPTVAGDIITLYIDGATEKGVVVTMSDAANTSGMDIYQDYLNINDADDIITNAHLNTANDGVDADITGIYSDGASPVIATGKTLYIASGSVFQPGAAVDINGNLKMLGSYNAFGNTTNIAGNLVNLGPSSLTCDAGISVVFDGGTAQTFDPGSSSSLCDVTLSGANTEVTLSTSHLTISGVGNGLRLLDSTNIFKTNGRNLNTPLLDSVGILEVRGSETLTITTMDIDSGTVRYVGNGDSNPNTYTIKDFGATDFYDLVIASTDSNDTFQKTTTGLVIAGALTVSNGTVDMNGQTASVTGVTSLSGGTYQSSTATNTFTGLVTLTGGTFTGSTGANTFDAGLTQTSGTTTFGAGTVDVNGNLVITAGTLTAPSTTLTLAGDFTNAGTFTHNSGTVTLDGVNQTITPTAATTFATLSKTESTDDATDKTLTFAGDITVATALTLDGLDATDRLNIVSSVPTTARTVTFTGASTFTGDFLDITDSTVIDTSTGVTAPINPANSINNSNTTNWFTLPGFTILAAGDLALTEGGTNATAYTVALNAQPASDVVIDISESSSAVTLNTAQLTFTSVNWATPQNVSVTGTEDANLISEADQLLTFTINDAGSDNDFDALADQTRNVDITDNDTPGFTILAAGDLALTEGATNATAYTVALNAQPASDVVIDISESSSAVTLNTAQLTFTSVNWATPQNVSVTGTEDANLISEADQLLTFTINDAGSDNDFDALADQTRNVDITDNDTPGFTILAAGDLALTEGATNATAYTVALNAQPASDVVIDISESSSAVTLNTAQLTFTSVNWATPQNVSVTGTEDANLISEADQLLTFTINDAGSDNDFDALADQTRNVDITDNDTPGFTILAAGDLALTEGATNATAYTVALNAQPASDVVIDISESSSAVTLNTAQLTFTSVNWATPQNVSVTGTEDANLISEADQLLTFTINDAGSDNDFDALADQTRNVDITDNDTPGFTILAAGDLALTEGATNATAYTVALNAQPASDVVIDISESSSAVTLNTAQLTFTSVNWATPQNVSVTGTEDANLISEADQLLTFTINDAGSDNDFDALADQTRNVDITDNDTPGFTILAAGDLALTEGATNATAYTVALNAQPASDVVIDISESSSAVTLNTAQLTFTSVNWATPQNVSVTGTEDANLISEADQLLTFTINDAGSDNDFDALADQTRNVDITDNDTPGFTILAAGDLALTEGATNATAYTVALNAQPASDVVIDISESSSAVTLNTAQLTFTSVNWATPQNVSVTGTEDANLISEADQLLTFTINDAGSDNDFDALADQTRNVDITDNDTPGFTILAAGDLALTEGATNATAYTVALNAQPASDVVIDISESSSAVTLNTAQLTFTSVNWATSTSTERCRK
jgi:hypothetical protein